MMQPVRLLFIAGTLTPGGAEKQFTYQAGCLVSMGVDVRVVSLDGEGYYGPQLEEIVEVDYVGKAWGRMGRLARIVTIARAYSPEIIQSTHTFGNIYAAVAGRITGAVSIGALRGDLPQSRHSNGRLTEWHIKLPDVMIANSRRGLDELRSEMGRPDGAAFVLDNAVDLVVHDREMLPPEILRQMAGVSSEDVLVLAVGRLRFDKAYDRFLRVLESARRRDPHIKGVVIGNGPKQSDLDTLVARSEVLQEGVTFLGYHPHAFKLMRGADIFMLTSDHEGVPNALLEAMVAGLPIITTPAGDAGILVDEAQGGFVRDFDDESGLVDDLVTLAADSSLRQAAGRRARQYAAARLDITHLPAKLAEVYSGVASSMKRMDLANRFALAHPSPEPEAGWRRDEVAADGERLTQKRESV